jgi:hypothetical protein
MLASRATLKRLGKRANVQLLINLALLEMVGAAHSLNPALAASQPRTYQIFAERLVRRAGERKTLFIMLHYVWSANTQGNSVRRSTERTFR